jgi:hypothetical protein
MLLISLAQIFSRDILINGYSDHESLLDISIKIIPVLNLILLTIVFITSKRKDRRDRKLLLDQIDYNAKLSLYKTLIIDPNLLSISGYFEKIMIQNEMLPQSELAGIIYETNDICNTIERQFISQLSIVSTSLENENILFLDEFRDKYIEFLAKKPLLELSNDDIEALNNLTILLRNKMYFTLYNFKPVILGSKNK